MKGMYSAISAAEMGIIVFTAESLVGRGGKMKNKENTDIWGIIALIAFVVMMFTVGASEAEYVSNTAFFIAFAVQASVWIYALYRAKAFIWQRIDGEEVKK